MHNTTNNRNPVEIPGSLEQKGRILLSIARSVIAEALGKQGEPVDENLPWLHDKGASFVTLTMNHQLRGCIGTLEAVQPLLQDIKTNAYAAAFRDPRFPPLTAAELDAIHIEISLLSTLQPLSFKDEADALAQLRPQIDGLVFKCGHYRSTFLPQVWKQLTDPAAFMAQLKRKAGLSPDFWCDDVEIYRYTVTEFEEENLRQYGTERLAS